MGHRAGQAAYCAKTQDRCAAQITVLAASAEKDVLPEARRLLCPYIVELWYRPRVKSETLTRRRRHMNSASTNSITGVSAKFPFCWRYGGFRVGREDPNRTRPAKLGPREVLPVIHPRSGISHLAFQIAFAGIPSEGGVLTVPCNRRSYSAYNALVEVSCSVASSGYGRFARMLIGGDNADHFAIRIPPDLGLSRRRSTIHWGVTDERASTNCTRHPAFP